MKYQSKNQTQLPQPSRRMSADHGRSWASGLRGLIFKHLSERGPMTTHELAGFCQVSVDAVAPRMSELEAAGEARDTGRRKRSVSGKGRRQKIWEATELKEYAAPDTGAGNHALRRSPH